MNKKCPDCGSLNVEEVFDGESYCKDCFLHCATDDLEDASLFDWLTQSPETLAENSVYVHVVGDSDEEKEYFFATPWTTEMYETIEAAVAAAVVKLKAVRNA